MSGLSCWLFVVLDKVFWLYMIIMLVYAVLSWVPDLRGAWSRWVDMLVEPVLDPVRRLIPPTAGIDWSFMIVFFILLLVDRALIRPNLFACY
ncbi:MAG TPA: YggT family protein [Candidatus Rubrimentiphilum sp.]|nr:YggT family protein [Candidatus Rubrimentiphilum sp.]